MKKLILKILVVILIVTNFFLLFLRWVNWHLDDKYGYAERIRMCAVNNDIKNLFAELDAMYSEIYYDIIYYTIVSLIFTGCLFLLFLTNNTSKGN